MEMNMKTGVYTYNDGSYNFKFKTCLSAYDKLIFVKSVVSTLVNDEGYDYVVRDLIFDFTIVNVFTDIDTSFISIKDDDGDKISPIIPIEKFLNETNVVDIVKANMEVGLLGELNRAVDLNIQYLTGIHPNPLNEAIASLVNTLENKINEVDLDSMMDMVQKFASMTDKFTPENVVNAYMNSDVHKKNLMDINEDKNKRAEFAADMDKAIKVANKNNAK